jgi:thymidylate kinase
MPFIAFLGCDGSGKSAVIQGLKSRLEQDGHRVTLGHWRPKALDPSSDSSESAHDPHGQALRGTAASILKLVWLWLNWWVAWFRSLKAASRTDYVLFDRYHGDLLVDPQRYRYGGPMWIAKIMVGLMPQPDRVIFLDASPEILISRKNEIPLDNLQLSRINYTLFIKNRKIFYLINAEKELNQVINSAYKLIKR